MSDADLALVRTSNAGFDLAVGEPFVIQQAFAKFYYTVYHGDFSYPKYGGERNLLRELEHLYPGKYVVVTNGAKHALLASIYALQVKEGRFTSIAVQSPYWPNIPSIADLSALLLKHSNNRQHDVDRNDINLLVGINNPDGDNSFNSKTQYDILDMAYGSPAYGWDGQLPWHRISVWSAAKLFGCSSHRVGWIVTGEKELADLASQYVELTTSGVSRPGQEFIANILENLRRDPQGVQEAYKYAHDALCNNAETLNSLRYLFSEVKGFPDSHRGMFAWVKAKDPNNFEYLLKKAGVRVVAGKFCGELEHGWYRISLGQDNWVMNKAVESILRNDLSIA